MTVVVGVDGSGGSRAALRQAAQEAQWRNVPLVVVAAYEPPLPVPSGGYPVAAMHTETENRAATESTLRDTVKDELGDQAGHVDMRVSAGVAGRIIVETARETYAQLVVLATAPARSVVPGTVSHHVLTKAECPVMVVPQGDAGHPS